NPPTLAAATHGQTTKGNVTTSPTTTPTISPTPLRSLPTPTTPKTRPVSHPDPEPYGTPDRRTVDPGLGVRSGSPPMRISASRRTVAHEERRRWTPREPSTKRLPAPCTPDINNPQQAPGGPGREERRTWESRWSPTATVAQPGRSRAGDRVRPAAARHPGKGGPDAG